MPHEALMAKAGGAIKVSSFVKASTAANQTLLQATGASAPILGIATEAAHDAPIPSNSSTDSAAVASGDQFRYYPIGSICRLKCSGGWTAGDEIVPTTNGAGLTRVTNGFTGAIALEAASDGEFGLVQVVCFYH